MTRKYTATLDGQITIEASTITYARQWAEQYGNTARRCEVRTKRTNKLVALHLYTPNGGGRWFKAEA